MQKPWEGLVANGDFESDEVVIHEGFRDHAERLPSDSKGSRKTNDTNTLELCQSADETGVPF